METTNFIVFFAWQSDVDQEATTKAIRAALRIAANRLEAEFPLRFVLDEATRSVPGAPYIPFEIARKIQSADVFVGDITSIFQFPGRGDSIPNPNVTFETGIASAHLGWNRMILLFNTNKAIFEKLPFDFDRHRISKYELDSKAKKLEGRIEPLVSILVDGFRLIAADRPKRPREIEGKSDQEIMQERDKENIAWFMRQFSISLMDAHFRDAPEHLHYFAPFMYDSMREVVLRTDFKLYDQYALDLIKKFTDEIGNSLQFDHLYRELNNNFIQAFGRRDQFRDYEEELSAASAIRASTSEARRLLDQLIEHIRHKYLSIDVDETSKIASNAYFNAIRDPSS